MVHVELMELTEKAWLDPHGSVSVCPGHDPARAAATNEQISFIF
jgi:hypothetical protein